MDAQNDSPAMAVVMVQQAGDGFVVVDAGGKEHEAKTDAELGKAMRAILADESLPKTESVPPNQARIEDVITEQVISRAPELAPYAKPAVQAAVTQIREALGGLERRRRRRAPKRTKPSTRARKPPRPGGRSR